MKFLHIADVHLGAKPDSGKLLSGIREKEIWTSLKHVLEVCRDDQVDLLLIAGDLFHRQPLLRELKELNSIFAIAPDTEIVIIAGNHDHMKSNSYYLTFRWESHVHMITSDEMDVVILPKIETAVYGFSYHEREITENRYHNQRAQKLEKYEILLAHGGDEKHVPFQRGELMGLGYDYIALGHIHRPGALLEDTICYAGALEPIDKNDVGIHGFIVGELTDQGCSAKFIPCALREYIHMDLPVSPELTNYSLMEKLRTEMRERGSQNLFKVTLTGYRDPDITFTVDDLYYAGNVVEIIDTTKPAYDYETLRKNNMDNILGLFIDSFKGVEEDSLEYKALSEGVQALLDSRE
ncbi:MAG: DNA repair exonuclease [Dorea sp.]|nr:DNA repair exonuclease [Dorea sp.]